MQNFSESEIQAKIAYNQKMADRFLKLFNENIKSAVVVVVGEYETYLAPVPVTPAAADELKKFFYEMSVYYVNERIKWDLAFDGGGSIPTVGKSSKP